MSGKIFINYRRGDDPGNTGRLFDRLLDEFEPDQLFMDVDSIPPGRDFVGVLAEKVAQCDILLAVIGKGWVDARDSSGVRRLDRPDDFVRIEIESALKQDKLVIPVLVHEARMPHPDELPEAIRSLARRNAVRLTHERFRSDTQSLVKSLQRELDDIAARRKAEEEASQKAQADEKRKREKEVARELEQTQREEDEKDRKDKETARMKAIAGLSPEQIAKAEELANWEFIKGSQNARDFRDHLARFPSGVCERMARYKLASFAWGDLGEAASKDALESYLIEFPDGPYSDQAIKRLADLDQPKIDPAQDRERERDSFEAARREDSSIAMGRFLSAYPQGQFASEALAAHAALVSREEGQRRALSSDNPSVLKAFLDSYPKDARAADIRMRLALLESERTQQKSSRKWLIGFGVGAATLAIVGIAFFALKTPAPGRLVVSGPDSIEFSGPQGGPFTPAAVYLRLQAVGQGFRWSTDQAAPLWLDFSPKQGNLRDDGSTEVVATPTPGAQSVNPGEYRGQITFKNETSGQTATRPLKLTVVPQSKPTCAFRTSRTVQPLSPGEECGLKPKDSFKECATCPEMVVIPPGQFLMGSPDSEPSHHGSESPTHTVNFAKPFAIGRFSVTFDEWDACVADGGCNNYKAEDSGWGRGKRPVISVTWDHAKSYVTWLAKKTGKPYRLVSEAEREYATRAGTTTPFWWGTTISTSQANYNGTAYNKGSEGENRKATLPVDSFQPNPWGLYQVHGNVWDWLDDCHTDYYQTPTDGTAATKGDCGNRILRGGSYSDGPVLARSAARSRGATEVKGANISFRVARTLGP